MTTIKNICLLGFGEVGQFLAKDLAAAGIKHISAYDPKFSDTASISSRALGVANVRAEKSASAAASGADLVICAVTAAACTEAANSVVTGIGKGVYFLDFNSASPGQKQAAGRVIEAAGGRYVEGAVMSPVSPMRMAAPILLGGPHASGFLAEAEQLGFSGMEVFSTDIGPAAATKLCRSVVVKGIEALLTESLLAARSYGIEDTVLQSLDNMFPLGDWEKRSRYMISRSLEHGVRRAEEMREASRTVAESGIEPLMSEATATRQDWAAAFREACEKEELGDMLDAILSRVRASTGGGK
jgi:3-hydroxyisobutyrate dehydrogenase-like beta-hydroxyacid dehydrogenase